MRTKEEILMNIFKQNYTERIFRFQKLVNHDLTLKAMQEYAEEYHRAELLKLNKSDVIGSVCNHSWFPTTKGYKRAWICTECKKVVHDKHLR
jgi:hypothetical protein